MKPLRPFVWTPVLLALAGVPTLRCQAATGPRAMMRASVQPLTNIWVGQQVRLHLDVLGRDGWARIKSAPDPEISGALVLRLETQGTRLQETIDGAAFTGQRYELLIFPRRAGTIAVPSLPVEVEIKQWGAQATSVVESLQTPALTFTAMAPPGATNLRDLVATPAFQAEQHWSLATNEFQVGDTLKRALRFQAEDVPGMAIPPRPAPALDGVAVYPAPPEVADSANRGDLIGRRTETVTFLFQRPGEVTLPDVEIVWWDLRNQELKREILPGRSVTVRPNPALAAQADESFASAGASRGSPWLGGTLLLLTTGLFMLVWQTRHRWHAAWQRWQAQRRETEPARFRHFRRAARTGDPQRAFNALMHWLDRLSAAPGPARLDRFLEQHGDPAGRQAAAEFVAHALGETGGPWNPRPLLAALTRARAHWLAQQRHSPAHRRLPPLNPRVPQIRG